MGLETYYCYIFYGLTLIYLTGPLSQVVQLKCDIYIYIYKEMCEREIVIYPIFLLFLGVLHIFVLDRISGRKGKSSLIPHSRTVTHPESSLENINGED